MTRQATRTVFGTHLLFMTLVAVVGFNPAMAQQGATVHPRTKFSASAPGIPPSGVSFLPVVTYSTGGSAPTSIAVADLNMDGNPDLVVAGEGAKPNYGAIEVLLGNGDGTFQTAATYSSGGYTVSSVAVADVNGDGKPDLVVSACSFQKLVACPLNSSGTVSILLGNGDGTFQAAVLYNSGGREASAVVVADVNGDGKPDLLVTNTCVVNVHCDYTPPHDGAVSVLLGNGDGTFQSAVNYDSGGLGPLSIAVSDINGDGKSDLIVANCGCIDGNFWNSGSVSVLLGNGDGTFGAAVPYDSGGSAPYAVVVADVNGDHKPDLVVGNSCWCGRDASVGVMLGNGDGTFQSAVAYDSGGQLAVSVAVADVNRDGLLDIVVQNQCPDSNCNTPSLTGVLLGNGDGTFQTVSTFDSGGRAVAVAVADVNGDGWPDLLTEVYAVVGVLLNGGSGEETPTTTSLASSLNPSVMGQAVTFTATVSSSSGAPPNGETITFKNGSSVLGTAPLSGGSASLTTSSLAAGIYTITARYPGDAIFFASNSPGLRQVVNSTTKSSTTTALLSSLNPSIYGQTVTFTATVTPSGPVLPSGKVTFTWNGYTLGFAFLNSSGVATFTKSNLNADTYPLQAVYPGDASNLGSTSSVMSQVVTQATSSATLTSSPNPSTSGQSVTFTATITSPTAKPTGPVTFSVGKTVLGTAELSSGKAKFTTSTLAIGTTTVTATYNGDSNIAKSSASVAQTVH